MQGTKNICNNMRSLCVLFSVLWNVYGECENYAVLRGHQGAIMELQYNTDGRYEFKSNPLGLFKIHFNQLFFAG